MEISFKIPRIAADFQMLQSLPSTGASDRAYTRQRRSIFTEPVAYWSLSLQIMGVGSWGTHKGAIWVGGGGEGVVSGVGKWSGKSIRQSAEQL